MYKLIQLSDTGFKELSTYGTINEFNSSASHQLDDHTYLVYATPNFQDVDKVSQTKIIQEIIKINKGRVIRFSSGIKIEKVDSVNNKSTCGHACWCVVDGTGRYCETCYPMNLPGCDGLCCWILRCASTC